MIGYKGGLDVVVKQVYEVVWCVILMCVVCNGGYKLLVEKYNCWKDVIIDFNFSGNVIVKQCYGILWCDLIICNQI